MKFNDTKRIDQNTLDKLISTATKDKSLIRHRVELAQFVAGTFATAGEKLLELGTKNKPTIGEQTSNDIDHEVVAISILLRFGSQLTSAISDLFSDGRHYAAAALLRQIVEIEYLAWAFDVGDEDGKRWLLSNKSVRKENFSPVKLRKAAKGKFRGEDYSFHCEFGGHPTPLGAKLLLSNSQSEEQILLVDLLGHVGRTWDHVVHWAQGLSEDSPIFNCRQEMLLRFSNWKSQDPLANLPPVPESVMRNFVE